MLDTLTLSHSCGCSTVPKIIKKIQVLKAKVRKAVRFENQRLKSKHRQAVGCDIAEGTQNPHTSTSNRNLEPWSNITTTPQRYHYLLALSLFNSLLFCCTALLAQKKIITIKEQLSDSADALIFEGCILAAQCRTLLMLLTQVGPKGFLTRRSEEWENTGCFGGGWIQR